MIKSGRILFLVVVTLFLMDCKKYPKPPATELIPARSLLHGIYELDKFIVNGIDSTYLIQPCTGTEKIPHTANDGRYFYEFTKAHDSNIKGIDQNGIYSFSTDKSKIGIGYGIGTNYNGRNILEPYKGSDGIWNILRLTIHEFWIKMTFKDLTFEVHLKKIHK